MTAAIAIVRLAVGLSDLSVVVGWGSASRAGVMQWSSLQLVWSSHEEFAEEAP